MSHIPTSAMPHAQAHDDQEAAATTQQADGRDPSPPEPTTATPDQPGLSMEGGAAPLKNGDGAGDQAHVMGIAGATSSGVGGASEPPLSSAAPGTKTGNRQGSDADRTAQAAGEPAATAASTGQAPVQEDAEEQTPANEGRSVGRTAGRAALALGGLAAIGGIIATVFPMVRDRNDGAGKGKKGKKRKA